MLRRERRAPRIRLAGAHLVVGLVIARSPLIADSVPLTCTVAPSVTRAHDFDAGGAVTVLDVELPIITGSPKLMTARIVPCMRSMRVKCLLTSGLERCITKLEGEYRLVLCVMRHLTSCASAFLILAFASACCAQQILDNGSFESGGSSWTINWSYSVTAVTSYAGVTPADGSRMLALAGPADVGYSYARIISQARSAPFGSGLPTDNFLVYLFASTYLHTTDGRNVSYAVTMEPGYGQVTGLFHGGPQDEWVLAQASGYYIAHDPFDATAPAKPITVSLELRDPLGPGEYLLLDDVQLILFGGGIPEPSAFAAVLAGLGLFITKARNARE
jgi:hypothetical protein